MQGRDAAQFFLPAGPSVKNGYTNQKWTSICGRRLQSRAPLARRAPVCVRRSQSAQRYSSETKEAPLFLLIRLSIYVPPASMEENFQHPGRGNIPLLVSHGVAW